MNADTTLLLAIHDTMSSAFMDHFMVFVTSLTNGGFIWILLGVILFFIPRTRPMGIAVLLAIALDSILVNLVIKPIVMRPRPYQALDLSILIADPSGSSFPSGHSSVAFAAASAYCLTSNTKFEKRFRWFLLFWAALTAFSRLYLLVHYPSDVIAGALIGVVVAPLAIMLTDWLYRKFDKNEHDEKPRKYTECVPEDEDSRFWEPEDGKIKNTKTS